MSQTMIADFFASHCLLWVTAWNRPLSAFVSTSLRSWRERGFVASFLSLALAAGAKESRSSCQEEQDR